MAPALVWSLSASPHCISPLTSLFRCPQTGLSFSHNLASAFAFRSFFPRNRGFQRWKSSESGVLVQAVVQERRGPGAKKKKIPFPKPRKERVILKPPLDDTRLAEKFLSSPQLSLNSFPLLSSCLPAAPLNKYDEAWKEEFLLEAKDALGLGSVEAEEGTPGAYLDTLLFLAFQHSESPRAKRAPYVRNGHSRLWFLGQYVLELALAELFLQMFPRETTGSLRERAFGLTSKKVLPDWFLAASMDRLVYPDEDLTNVKRDVREAACKYLLAHADIYIRIPAGYPLEKRAGFGTLQYQKFPVRNKSIRKLKWSESYGSLLNGQGGRRSVFWALIGAIYLTLGMPEVYRVLFEVFGFDVDAERCQPNARNLEDEDYLSPELDGKTLSWQDIAYYQPPPGALFAEPRLFRACVPPGMHRFRGNVWEAESLPTVMRVLGYPLPVAEGDPEAAVARRTELELGLQLCFLHPSTFKLEHPRFCYERLEFLGQKVQDVIMAEKLLMKHLDGPGVWLEEKHRRLLLNRLCGRYLRDHRLQHHIVYADERKEIFDKARRLRNFATTGVSQAIIGIGYVVYGRPEVRRLMFRVFNFEQLESPIE